MASKKNPAIYKSKSGKLHIYCGERERTNYWGRSQTGHWTLCGCSVSSWSEVDDIETSMAEQGDFCTNCWASYQCDDEIILGGAEDVTYETIPAVDQLAIRKKKTCWHVFSEDGNASVCGNAKMVAKILGTDPSEVSDETSFLPIVDTIAVRNGEKAWTIFENGVEVGTVKGDKKIVEKVVGVES